MLSTPSVLLLFLIKFLVVIVGGSKYYSEECDRIRRPLQSLTTDEKMLYVEGFQKLRENGKLEVIVETHHFKFHSDTHRSSAYYFWHFYLIWEVETQIRNLGGKFACFAMPFWDFTADWGSEENAYIFADELFGGDGLGPKEDYCMSDVNDLWSSYYVPAPKLCVTADETSPYCCLKRERSTATLLPSPYKIAQIITESDSFKLFLQNLSPIHGQVHVFLSSGNHKVAISGSWSAYDPIFFLLHTYFDFIHNLWTDCWNFADLNEVDLSSNHNAFQPWCAQDEHFKNSPRAYMDPDEIRDGSHCGAIKLDDVLNYRPMNVESWALASTHEFTIKDMYDITNWGVKYEAGSTYKTARIYQVCQNNNPQFADNDEWFVQSRDEGDEYLKSDVVHSDVDNLWERLDKIEIDEVDKFKIVDSFSCKYARQNSQNSCWDEKNMKDLEIETCDDRGISAEDARKLTLEELLRFDGVSQNECLIKIREDAFGVSENEFFQDIKYELCSGRYDYQCPQYEEPLILSLKKFEDELNGNENEEKFVSLNFNKSNETNTNLIYIFVSIVAVSIIFTLYCFVQQYYSKNQYKSLIPRSGSNKIKEEYIYQTF